MIQAELVERFASLPERLAVAARGVADRPMPAGEWGPRQVVRHLIAVEREVWLTRFESIATEDEPHWPWTEPGLEPGLEDASLDEVLARFADARARSIAILDGFDEAGWARTAVHAAYGRLDGAGLLGIANDHDAEHLRGLVAGDGSNMRGVRGHAGGQEPRWNSSEQPGG